MTTEQLKIIEVHDILDAHEWKHVSKSFETCKCGMCRGSSSMFHSKGTRRQRRQRGQVTTDWVNLSKVTCEQNWFRFKMKYVDRIQEYLVRYPFWAGHYAKKTGDPELIKVMKEDPDLLLAYSLEHKEFDEEVEERLRGNATRLLSFLEAKKSYMKDEELEVSEESRLSILLNGDCYQIVRLAKLDGAADDIRTTLCEKSNSDELIKYASECDKAASPEITRRLIELTIAKSHYNTPSDLVEYADEFKMMHDPEIKGTLFKTADGIESWMYQLEYRNELTPAITKEARAALIAFEATDELLTMIGKRIFALDAELLTLLVTKESYRASRLPLPKEFDRSLWEVLLKNPESTFAVDFLKLWKRQLRIQWTKKQAYEDEMAERCEAQGKMTEAKVWRKQRAATSKWAHSLLVEYKRIVKKDD